MPQAHPIAFGRAICGDLAGAERREWLVTNGNGGFASGTIAGTLTRRYHGLLIAALSPPRRRTLLATKLDERVRYGGAEYAIAANRWQNGRLDPQGFAQIERFYLDATTPVWQYALGDALLEKRIWMEPGENVTYVRYTALRAAAPLAICALALVNYRSFHANTHAGGWEMSVTLCPQGIRIEAYPGAAPFRLVAERGDVVLENVWYRDFVLAEETRRGLDDRDDNLGAGRFEFSLAAGESVTIAAALDDAPASVDGEAAWRRRAGYDAEVLRAWHAAAGASAPAWATQCALAADQFVVRRPVAGDPAARGIIAGYHWFGEWGRDAAIALPGLALATGRPEIAKSVLLAFASLVDGGMLPNFLPEDGSAREYNTVDAALWYVEAAARYVDATGDASTLRALWPALRSIVQEYRDGTRLGIHMDADGLIAAAAPGVQLTWMDAKVGDWVVTPRMGKPVEVCALWYNALERMRALASLLGEPGQEYERLANLARGGFARFWNAQTGYCYDVLDGPTGDDDTFRPNQIIALALEHSPLEPQQRRSIVDACAATLLTTNGLRTLAPSDPHFVPAYGGSPHDRDAAYHQGTVWPWLLGPFALAHAKAYGDRERALSFLEPLADQLSDYGLGSISEIADGAAPFAPRGAIAQAWSVATLLDAWRQVRSLPQTNDPGSRDGAPV